MPLKDKRDMKFDIKKSPDAAIDDFETAKVKNTTKQIDREKISPEVLKQVEKTLFSLTHSINEQSVQKKIDALLKPVSELAHDDPRKIELGRVLRAMKLLNTPEFPQDQKQERLNELSHTLTNIKSALLPSSGSEF